MVMMSRGDVQARIGRKKKMNPRSGKMMPKNLKTYASPTIPADNPRAKVRAAALKVKR